MRAEKAMKGIRGKRLMYCRPDQVHSIKQLARKFLRWRRTLCRTIRST